MIPSLRTIAEVTHELLYESVSAKLPIDYARSLLIISDTMDFRNYQWRREQELEFCVPLREKVVGENIRCIPGSKARSCSPGATPAWITTRSYPLLRRCSL